MKVPTPEFKIGVVIKPLAFNWQAPDPAKTVEVRRSIVLYDQVPVVAVAVPVEALVGQTPVCSKPSAVAK